MKVSARILAVAATVSMAFLAATPADASFVIIPVFDSSIANDPNAAAIENCINSVIALYERKFIDNITVKIYFQEGGGLGSSLWGYYYNNAGVAIQALTNDVTSPDDAVAVSHLNTNVFGSVAYTTANGRAMGLDTPGFLSVGSDGGYDGVITLNTSICFYDHNNPIAGRFDLFSATAHELDEILGTPSGASDWLAYSTDLFRYDGNGGRSFSGDTNAHAFFSIDTVTNIVEYNQYQHGGGDWGDWVPHDPHQTQDWVIGSGVRIDPGESEFRLLDVIGYNRSTVVPDGFTIARGSVASGGLDSLYTVDANPLVLRPGLVPIQGDYPAQIVLVGTSRTATPSSLRFLLTSKAQLLGIGQTIELYDFADGRYEVVDFRQTSQAYAAVEVVATNPIRFVDPVTNHVQARIKYKATQPLMQGAWTVSLDQAVWEIVP